MSLDTNPENEPDTVADALDVVILAIPLIGAWARAAIANGRDPRAELEAMFVTAETQARALEKAKFG